MMRGSSEYKRKLLAHERRPFRGPNANVVVNMRIKGDVSDNKLIKAMVKAQRRHRLLNSRVYLDEHGEAWFTSEGVTEIPLKTLQRQSDNHWIEVCLKEYDIPYEFDNHPAIRFILLYTQDVSDLIIMCHHMICDAMSLAYLARDIMQYLSDESLECSVLPDPPLVSLDNVPIKESGIGQKLIYNFLNKRWKKQEVQFDQKDYLDLCQAYAKKYTSKAFCIELTEIQTNQLVSKCREEKVTVNTTLLNVLLAAQNIVQGASKPYLQQVATAMDIRKHLINKPGESFGFYAGGMVFKYLYLEQLSFWDNARKLHDKLKKEFKPEKTFEKIIAFSYLPQTMFDAMIFKQFGAIVEPHQPQYGKINSFSARKDVLSLFIKDKSWDKVRVGVVLSNLTRLDFPVRYNNFELNKMMFLPAGSYAYQKAVGVVTVNGKLTLTVSYVEESVDSNTMADFKAKILEIITRETA